MNHVAHAGVPNVPEDQEAAIESALGGTDVSQEARGDVLEEPGVCVCCVFYACVRVCVCCVRVYVCFCVLLCVCVRVCGCV